MKYLTGSLYRWLLENVVDPPKSRRSLVLDYFDRYLFLVSVYLSFYPQHLK